MSGHSFGIIQADEEIEAIQLFLQNSSVQGCEVDYADADLRATEVKTIQGFPDNVLRDLRELIGPDAKVGQAHALYSLGCEDLSYNPPIWWIANMETAIEKVLAD